MVEGGVVAKFRPNNAGQKKMMMSAMVLSGVRHYADRLLAIADVEAPDGPARSNYAAIPKLNTSGEVVKAGRGWRVQYTSPIAALVHEGTRAHVITAKHGGKLRFKGRDGQWVYRKSVNHPGTKGNPWLWRSVLLMREER